MIFFISAAIYLIIIILIYYFIYRSVRRKKKMLDNNSWVANKLIDTMQDTLEEELGMFVTRRDTKKVIHRLQDHGIQLLFK